MTPETKGLRTKKYIIITLGITATIVAILIAILVGMHMFTEAQKEIVKVFSFKTEELHDYSHNAIKLLIFLSI